jgi:hypothetical protein
MEKRDAFVYKKYNMLKNPINGLQKLYMVFFSIANHFNIKASRFSTNAYLKTL